jgi:large subunit ribosomal protein L28
MAVQCEVCGKKPSYGHNVSHAKNHTPRRWVPNIQVKRVMLGDQYVRLKICTRCLRTMSKNERAAAKAQ